MTCETTQGPCSELIVPPPQMPVRAEPQTMTLFGNGTFADVIS